MSKKAAQLLEDINAHAGDKRASMKFLKAMGYIKSTNKVIVKMAKVDGSGEDHCVVFELLDKDKPERTVPFSFLYDRAREDGVVLPFPFSRYEGMQKASAS